MSAECVSDYIAEIGGLKRKYESDIKVFCGIEEDYYSDDDLSLFDYSIGSVHFVLKDGKYLEVDHSPKCFGEIIENNYGGDAYAFVSDYYRIMGDTIRKTGADIVGHFDVIAKFNEDESFFNPKDVRYVNAATDALDSLLPTGRPFEVNTGAISRGYRTEPYPSFDILSYIHQNGGTVILSSDSHSPENLIFGFEEAYELVKKVGFNSDSILLELQ